MSEATDLTRAELEGLLGDRPLRTYPAILSTEAEALAWARDGAPHGSLVVAGYQASPRGRSGLSWGDHLEPGHGLGASLVLRPDLPVDAEGWLYTATLVALHDVFDDTVIAWPDRLERDGTPVAMVGVQVEPAGDRLRWAVVSVLVPGAEPPRGELLARLATAIDARSQQPPDDVLPVAREHCATLGERVVARMLPLGPAAPMIEGTARDLTADGGLSIRRDDGATIVVLPQALGFLEDPDDQPGPPDLSHVEA